jgi:hypothetical protein
MLQLVDSGSCCYNYCYYQFVISDSHIFYYYCYCTERGLLAPEGTREYHEQRGGLPANATKTVIAGQYEEVHIPARIRTATPGDDAKLVPISALEPWAQSAFK